MQKILTVEANKKIVDILWEFLNQPFASISIKYRHYAYLIYREIYYEFQPVFYDGKTYEKLELDVTWFDFESHHKHSGESGKERRILTLNKIELTKRKKSGKEKWALEFRSTCRVKIYCNILTIL